MIMTATTVYIALGSNLGDRRSNLIDAISQLRQKVKVEQLSSVYETEPAYVTDQPRFLNMVLRGSTALSPQPLLHFLKTLERRLGRQPTARYGPRPIDLDILVYGEQRIDEPDLTIPHPRLTEREFVLKPLAEIAPDLVLPGQSDTVAALAGKLDGTGRVVRVERALSRQFTRDVQDEAPPAHLSLMHVGVTGVRRIIRLTGDQRDELFDAVMDLFVELRPDQKGAHMSRFSNTIEEILGEIDGGSASTLERMAERIARQVLRDQRARRADVRLRAPFPLARYAPVSGRLTQEIYTLVGMAAATERRVVNLVGVEAEGMMACPCAQDMIAQHARDRLLETGFTPEQADRALEVVPLATHNQRGRGTLLVGTDMPIDAQDLVGIVEGAMSSENYDLLKRPDELFVVAKAHRRPRFVEDAARDMIDSLIEQYPDLPDDAFVQARQINFETIHKHEVYAECSGTLGELRQEIAARQYLAPHASLDAWLRAQLAEAA
jgi:GTP cyclohydrolase-4